MGSGPLDDPKQRFESHQSGIETREAQRQLRRVPRFESHQSGIETRLP